MELAQFGFFFDQSRCTNCMACAIACKGHTGQAPGAAKPLRMVEWETGAYPNVRLNVLFLTCFHCANPLCIDAAVKAGTPGIYKEEKYGAVLIDPAYSGSLRAAAAACPYGAIVYGDDASDSPAVKCDMCLDKLESGNKPVCVMACAMRALDFDEVSTLATNYGKVRDLEGLPSSTTTTPSLVVKPHDAKKQLVVYDSTKALQLMGAKEGFQPLYTDPADVTTLPDGLLGRSKAVVKPKNADELIKSSRNDEG
jgi:anaerobic dimethyl sulfoxide reductase subunit B (iron-sulfur subunit)